jgi:sulfur-oxidizing protein SoxX
MKTVTVFAAAGIALVTLSSCSMGSGSQRSVDPQVVERYVQSTFGKAPPEWQARVKQDETQRICTQYRNDPPTAEYEKITQRELASVVYPADGKLLGDWKAGEAVAQNGRGGQFSDPPNTVSGGNCYACHQMAATEVSFGTIGPSLLHYGKDRNYDAAEIRNAFTKIYNAQAVVACSNMPRFGHSKILNEKQIKDVVAYLFDPASPVNK